MILEDLPNILTAQDISKYLRIGRKRVYELMTLSPDHGGIPSFSIVRSRRVELAEFEKWIEDRKREQTNRFDQ
ncbi:helix-turn-helix domain-containing protein [Cohnella rhizosphaerae]|uniref:helix-turn-helix domain-containing protein n=1 Tax=Cohnella rhizosphaerae TaxID=1457232 RepID=UPI003B8A9617